MQRARLAVKTGQRGRGEREKESEREEHSDFCCE